MGYTPTQWDTIADKEKFEKQFKKFVLGGMQEKDFPKWFYSRLSMCFGHIAHYNQGGFYATWFNNTDSKAKFLENALRHTCCGDPAFVYSDVERVLQQWIRENGLLKEYQDISRAKQEADDRAQLAALKAKYEVSRG